MRSFKFLLPISILWFALADATTLNDSTSVIQIKKVGKKIYANSKKLIYEIKSGKQHQLYLSTDEIVDFIPQKESIIYCTENEIFKINNRGIRTRIKHSILKPQFVQLCSDLNQNVLVGSKMNGLYQVKNDSLQLIHFVFPINSISATKDSAIWIATNIGLHRIKNERVITYKEEGTSNFELADNTVEKLIVDNFGDLWIKMTDAISVISAQNEGHHHEHLPTIKFIGSPENELYAISYHNGLGYLFSTKEGMILMPIGTKEDNMKFFEIAEEKAAENPHANLSVLRKVYYKNTSLITQVHLSVNNKSILVNKGNKLEKLSVNDLIFK